MTTTIHSFLTRLDAVVRELDDHPRIRVSCYHRGPPAPLSALRALEARLGGPCPPALERLYATADGVQLRWHVRPQSTLLPWPPREPAASLRNIDLLDEDGVINFLPLEELLAPSPHIRPGSVLFDAFSGYSFTLLTTRGRPPGRAGRGTAPGSSPRRHGSCAPWWFTRTLTDYGLAHPKDGRYSLTDYFERLLVTRGLMIARTRSYTVERAIPMPALPPRWRGDPEVLEGLLNAAEEGW